MTRTLSLTTILQWVTILMVLIPLFGLAGFVWQKHNWATDRLAELEPRYARLQGLLGSQVELDTAVRNSQNITLKYAYPANLGVTQAGNDAQQRIRAAFVDSRNSVESIQVLGSKDVDGFQRIGIVVQVDSTLPDILEALLKLRDQTPVVLVDSFSLQSTGAVRSASVQRLTGNLNFSVLKVRE